MTGGQYSNKLRVRSCGILFEDDKVLLVELRSPITNEWVWMPPGGGVEFGESLEEALVREYLEETGLIISVKEQMYVNEVIDSPIHAIEFYFIVEKIGGNLSLGYDPESEENQQILRNIGFFSKKELKSMNTQPDFLKYGIWEFLAE